MDQLKDGDVAIVVRRDADGKWESVAMRGTGGKYPKSVTIDRQKGLQMNAGTVKLRARTLAEDVLMVPYIEDDHFECPVLRMAKNQCNACPIVDECNIRLSAEQESKGGE